MSYFKLPSKTSQEIYLTRFKSYPELKKYCGLEVKMNVQTITNI